MLIEAHTVDQDTLIESDICVVGCGPAGLTLIKDLIPTGIRICAIESGGRNFEQSAQDLSEGTTISPDRYPSHLLMAARRRQLGGTANLWDDELNAGEGDELVRLLPLDEIDFEKRTWIPHSGWPFDKSELDPFYERGLRLSGAGPLTYEVSSWKSRYTELPIPAARVRTMMSQFGLRSIFTRDLPNELASAENVHVYLDATLLELILNEDRVEHARIAAAPGREFQISAKIFVLAAGGIENARLLLLSNSAQRHALGNQHDLVGRFFMDHPAFRLGVLTPADSKLFRSVALYDHHVVNGVPVMGKLTFCEEVMRREHMLNIGATLTPRGRDYESHAANVVRRMAKSKSTAAAAKLLRGEFRSIVTGLDEVLLNGYARLTKKKPRYSENKGGWSRLQNSERRFRKFEVSCLAEQSPIPDNRVTLSNDQDRFGQRKVELHWRWSEIDLRSIRRAQEILKEEVEQCALGKFETQAELDQGKPPLVTSPHHHLGTTRMHTNPREGVVDANGRVHGIPNLYLAGSSVFPTGGFANPTLTIIALTLRLSYHLKALMKSPASSVSPSHPHSPDQSASRP
ncbi:MAG TPA: GMC family oxidoreductase [Chthoniobacterales bacterium]|jgi:choline dehydrogenase-like flavoprotein